MAPAKLFLLEPSVLGGLSYPLLPQPLHPRPPSARKPRAPLNAELARTTKASWFWEQSRWGRALPFPGSRLTFQAHAVVKTFVVEAAVVGCAEMFPEVTASSWQHSKHMWSAELSGSAPPAALPRPTGQEIHQMCGRPCPGGPSGVQGSGPELLLDAMEEVPRGGWQRLEPPQMGHLIDHGRIKGGVGLTSRGWGCNS